MKLETVKLELDSILKLFGSLIIDRNYKTFDKSISWEGYIPGISKKLYAKEYEYLLDLRQYSFILINRGLVQFYYSFDENNELEMARLCYYPYPVKVKEGLEDLEDSFEITDDVLIGEYYFDLYNLLQAQFGSTMSNDELNLIKAIAEKYGQTEGQILEERFHKKYLLSNTSHFRIDFDRKVNSHNKIEIQYSGANTLRLPITHLVSPFVFMDFVVSNEFKSNHVELTKNPHYSAYFSNSKRTIPTDKDFKTNNIHVTISQ